MRAEKKKSLARCAHGKAPNEPCLMCMAVAVRVGENAARILRALVDEIGDSEGEAFADAVRFLGDAPKAGAT